MAKFHPFDEEHRQIGSVAWLAVMMLVVSGAAIVPAFAWTSSQIFEWQQLRQAILGFGESARQFAQWGYATAPALMLALAVCGFVPVVALTVRCSQVWRRTRKLSRRYRSGVTATKAVNDPATTTLRMLRENPAPRLDCLRTGKSFPVTGAMLRIGREADNDVRINEETVHRYHAALHRNHNDGWTISDLATSAGGGVVVNGDPYDSVDLDDGDIIEIGTARLQFRSARSSHHKTPSPRRSH